MGKPAKENPADKPGTSKETAPDKEQPGTSGATEGEPYEKLISEAQNLAAIIANKMQFGKKEDLGKLFKKRQASPDTKSSKRQKVHEVSESESDDYSDDDEDYDSSDYETEDEETEPSFKGFSSKDVQKTEKAGSSRELLNIPNYGQINASVKVSDQLVSQSLLDIVNSYMKDSPEVKGPPIDAQILPMVVKAWEAGDLQQLDMDKLEKHVKQPANTPFIQSIDLNPAVFLEVQKKEYVKNREISLKSIQKGMIKAGQALAHALSKVALRTTGTDRAQMMDDIMDALDCIATASGKLTMSRKYNLRSCIDPMYMPLLKKPGTSGGLLLGSNLVAEMKEIEDQEKIRVKASRKHHFFNKKKKFYKHGYKKHFRGGKSLLHNVDDYAVHSSDSDSQSDLLSANIVVENFCNTLANMLIDVHDSDLNDSHYDWVDENCVINPRHCRSKERERPRQALLPQEAAQRPAVEPPAICPSTSQVSSLNSNPVKFKAEGIKHKLSKWQELTSDHTILDMVKGVTIEFKYLPVQDAMPHALKFSEIEFEAIKIEVDKMLRKEVIERAEHSQGEFLSNLFTRPKKDTTDLRAILNLRKCNEAIIYRHFKIDDLPVALSLLRQNFYLAVVDIKEGFHNVSVRPSYRKFLRFIFDGQLYQYTCMANGLSSAPRYFTKLLKVPLAYLRERFGILCSAFFDDILVAALSRKTLKEHVQLLTTLLEDLGFVVNWDKSLLEFVQELVYLGMILNTVTMRVTLPQAKIRAIITLGNSLGKKPHVQIRTFASFVGQCVATFPGNRYGPLHTKALEQVKNAALGENGHDFDAYMDIGKAAMVEIHWWIDNVEVSWNYIIVPEPHKIVYSDASNKGYGFHEPASGRKGGAVDRTRTWKPHQCGRASGSIFCTKSFL